MSIKRIVTIGSIIFTLFFVIYQVFLKEKEPEFDLTRVVLGNVYQEVSETGQVKKGDKINLSFNAGGIIERIYVKVGGNVKEGDILAKLDREEMVIQLEEAQANLDITQAKLDKLLAGATEEEIQIAQTTVDNARASLGQTILSLEDTRVKGVEDLRAACEDALNTLDDAYLKIQNAFNTADLIQKTYFTRTDQGGVRVRENRDIIKKAKNQVKPFLDTAKNTEAEEDIDLALSEVKKALNSTAEALRIIRDTCDEPIYRNTVSSTSKSSLDTQRGYIYTALTNITNAQQTISLTKITNTTNLNTAQSKVETAEGSLKAAEDELTKLIAPPREEDVNLYGAQVVQARTQVKLLENQIEDTILKSPVTGQIIEVNKKEGEIVKAALQDVVASVLSDIPFEIEADIYEEDVAKIKVGNEVDISLIAFTEETLIGKVLSINPSEKVVEGVVYYEVSIGFADPPSGVKPGMTADLIIRTDSRENVLVVPEDAILEKNGKATVQFLEQGQVKEKEIEVGLFGTNDMVEVISGLREGEEIIIP
jgi:RND family efflux transporter MFP subunit